MIEFTIKTLDSKDHRFTVEDEITVQQLKEKVLEQMGVEIGLQRLIFCGRVLQDEKKLAEYGVHGKVIHMVQRAPPFVEAQLSAARERDRERERENTFTNQGVTVHSEPISMSPVHLNHFSQQQIRRLMALAASAHGIEIEEQPGPNLSPTASRLEFLRRLITEIKTNLDALKTSESDEPRTFSNEDPLESTSSGGFSSVPEEIDHGLGASRVGRGRRIRSMRPNQHTPPRDFGQLVEELHELHGEFAPFREIYINTLREASDPEVNLSEDVLQRRQLTADLCAELYHSFSHAYHTISDIVLLMAHGNSRLTSDALTRHPLPVHAHINVMQATPTRRPPNATATSNGATQASASDGQEAQTSTALAGRNTTQPTVNINIQHDPGTYQVEIETEVPIPINIGNVFMNGTVANQNNTHQSQQSQNDAQSNQDGPNDRRQAMMDFENLFRGLGQAGRIGGVEVVMSMEEDIPQVNGGTNNNNSAPTMGSQPTEGGGNPPRTFIGSQMYLAQTADLLHNLVASVFRQGLVPGMEGVMHAQLQQIQGQSQTQGQRQGQGQAQPQTQSQSESQPQVQNLFMALNPTPTQEPSQENRTNTEQNANANSANASTANASSANATTANASSANANSANASQQRQQTRNRGSRVHSQTVSIFNLVYDRFLSCDSLHARRQLQRRRDESIQAGGPRLQDNSTTRIQNNVETLFERFDRHAIDEESLMIAAMLTLREATSFSVGRTLEPDELLPLRQRLQVYMRDLMQGEYEVGTQEQLADLIFERHSEFINRIATITPMRPNIDVISSMKAVFIRFLNEAMLVLGMANNDVFSRRFRIVFPRLFYELCGVISYCCLEGVEGLRKIYRSFVTGLIQNVDEPVRDLLHSLAMENLNAAVLRVEGNKIHYPQFIRRKEQPSCSTRADTPIKPMQAPRSYGILRPLGPIDSPNSIDSTDESEPAAETVDIQITPKERLPKTQTRADTPIKPMQAPRSYGILRPLGPIDSPNSIDSTDESEPAAEPVDIQITPKERVPKTQTRADTPIKPVRAPRSYGILRPLGPIDSPNSIDSTDESEPAAEPVDRLITPKERVPKTQTCAPIKPVRAPRSYGILRPLGPIDSPNSIDSTDESEPAAETVDILITPTEEVAKTQSSSPMEFSSQEASPAAPEVGPTEDSTDKEESPDDVTPPLSSTGAIPRVAVSSTGAIPRVAVSSTGAIPRVAVTSNRSRVNEDASTAQNFSESVGSFEAQGSDSANLDCDRYRRESPQSSTAETSGQCSQVTNDDDGLNWPEPSDEIQGGSYDPNGRVSAMHNRGRFRREQLRYPGSGHGTEASVSGPPHRSPTPPLEPVGQEELQPVRDDSIRGRYRQEILRPALEGQSSESASASASVGLIVPTGPINGLVSGRIDQNGRVSSMHNRGRFRPSRQPKPSSTNTLNSSDDNMIFVPPAHIAQHWGEEWVPTFTRDIHQQQAAEACEPHSDAYLSGMPPKKRRCVRQARPSTTLNALFTESMSEVREPLGEAQREELRATFREHLRSITRSRAAAARDYEARRFVATERFLNQPRTLSRRPPETDSD